MQREKAFSLEIIILTLCSLALLGAQIIPALVANKRKKDLDKPTERTKTISGEPSKNKTYI